MAGSVPRSMIISGLAVLRKLNQLLRRRMGILPDLPCRMAHLAAWSKGRSLGQPASSVREHLGRKGCCKCILRGRYLVLKRPRVLKAGRFLFHPEPNRIKPIKKQNLTHGTESRVY